jgi:RNA polymerase sigma-70 factor, ECF subfamily
MEEQANALLPQIMEARDRFMELVEELRPELHRYCARMTGSVFDGEDIVQDTLAKAYFALGQMYQPPNLRPWLFRIAHNAAMDFLKRYERQHVESVADVPESVESEEPEIDPLLVESALSIFTTLPPVQRSALILKDVLGHSLEETAATMGATVGAVKAALSRARTNVERDRVTEPARHKRSLSNEQRATLQQYVDFFNTRDWDGLRTLLGKESQLDVVSRVQARMAEAGYTNRYAKYLETETIRAEAGFADGVPAIAMFSPASSTTPSYFVLLETEAERIERIRDFRYVPYIARDARFSTASPD